MDDSRFICPECKDTGIVYYNGENGYLYARPCKCRAVKEAKMRIERSGLAKLFKSKTFDSFKTYSDPILEDAKRTVMRFAETFESHGEEEANSLLLCGQVGAGKTHLGAACRAGETLGGHGTGLYYGQESAGPRCLGQGTGVFYYCGSRVWSLDVPEWTHQHAAAHVHQWLNVPHWWSKMEKTHNLGYSLYPCGRSVLCVEGG